MAADPARAAPDPLLAARRGLDLVVGAVSCTLLSLLVVVLVWQVVSRYALNAPSTSSEEILRYGVIWMSLLGAAYASGRGSHMTVDLLRDRLTGRADARGPVEHRVFAVHVQVNEGVGCHLTSLRRPSDTGAEGPRSGRIPHGRT